MSEKQQQPETCRPTMINGTSYRCVI